MSKVRLLDVSGIFFPIWRVKEAQNKPVGDAAAETVQALRERAASGGADYTVACCDTGRSFRHEVAQAYRETAPDYKGYKAHRPEKDAALLAALDRVIDELEQDGIPIMRAAGYEADDVIATITKWAFEQGHDVEVFSEDKDLCALIRDASPDNDTSPSVVVVRRDGTRQDVGACVDRIGVPPTLVAPFLALAGDDSDGVLGIPGVGKKTAVSLLWGEHDAAGQWQRTPYKRFDDIVSAAVEDQVAVEQSEREIQAARLCQHVHRGTKKGVPDDKIAEALKIDVADVATYRAMTPPARLPEAYKPRFAENVRKSIVTNAAHFDIGLRLTALATDVPLDFAQVTAPRVPKPKPHNDQWKEQRQRAAEINATVAADPAEAEEEEFPTMIDQSNIVTPPPQPKPEPPPPPQPLIVEHVPMPQPAAPVATAAPVQTTALAKPQATVIRHARSFEMELEPRNIDEAMIVAEYACDSKLFKDITSPQQALVIMQLGRKFGLAAMDSLRMIHMIEGKPCMSAQLIVGIVQKSGLAEYFELDSVTATGATWITKRKGARKEKSWEFTIDDAKAARLGGLWDKQKNVLRDTFDPNSNWAKYGKVMCSWRAAVFLARAVYADLVGGLYMPDEIGAEVDEIDGNPPMMGLAA